MEVSELLLLVSILACVFGILYLHYMTRHRERMALIQKGGDASIFYPAEKTIAQLNRFLILNISFTLIGIGTGIALGILLYSITDKGAVYPASIFIMAGFGLLTSFLVNQKMNN